MKNKSHEGQAYVRRNSLIYSSIIPAILFAAGLGICQSANETPLLFVEGTVVSADDSHPIDGAIVVVVPEAPGQAQAEPTGTKTGTDGQFRIATVAAKKYQIRCQKPGFLAFSTTVASPGPSSPSPSAPPARVGPLSVRMVAQAVVAGQITDQLGSPMEGATVRLSRVYQEGSRTALSNVAQASTNDLGQYRISGVEPGRYYVSASYQDVGAALGIRRRPIAEGAADLVTEDYAVVYYPDSRDPESATPVSLHGGHTTENINMTIGMAQSFPVGGVVTGLPAESPAPRVFLQPADPASLGPMRLSIPRPGDASFRFKSVPPGNYVLRAELNVKGQVLSAREEVSVSSSVAGVELRLQPPFAVPGVVVVESGSEVAANFKLKMRAVDRRMQDELKVDDRGRFQIQGASPDSYAIAASDDSGKIYVKDIFLDDRPSPTGWITLTGPNHVLRVSVSDKAGRIDGAALDASQRPASSGLAVLVSAELQRPESYAASVGPDGRFKFQSLPPGKYRLLCFSDLSTSQDATWDVQRRTRSDGKEISLGEGDSQQISVEMTRLDPM